MTIGDDDDDDDDDKEDDDDDNDGTKTVMSLALFILISAPYIVIFTNHEPFDLNKMALNGVGKVISNININVWP